MPLPPGIRLARRPLHFLYICDCSGSMNRMGKIEALNQAIRQSLPGMVAVARRNPQAQVLVRAVRFADRAAWHIATPTPVEELQWTDLEAQPRGMTAMGDALRLVAAALDPAKMEPRAMPPVLVLISDGSPTDHYADGLATLMRQSWAAKSVRLGIAVGHDADLEVLQQFIGQGGRAGEARRPLLARDATALAQYIEWASTDVMDVVSVPRTIPDEEGEAGTVPLPPVPTLAPTEVDPVDAIGGGVW